MPTYQFTCSKCGAAFTAVQTLSDSIPEPKCQVCKIKMDRVFGLQTVIFRGSGWGKDAR